MNCVLFFEIILKFAYAVVMGYPPEFTTQTVYSKKYSSHLGQYSGIWGPKCSPRHLEQEAFKVKPTSSYLVMDTQASRLTKAELR